MRLLALRNLVAASLLFAGFFMVPLARVEASKPQPAKTAEPMLRGEAPHIGFAVDKHRVVGEFFTVTGVLRGYKLGSSDFCLEPRWVVFGSGPNGELAEIQTGADPVQCRDHEFSHAFKFTNAGTYGLRLELRTTGSRVRLQDVGMTYADVEAR